MTRPPRCPSRRSRRLSIPPLAGVSPLVLGLALGALGTPRAASAQAQVADPAETELALALDAFLRERVAEEDFSGSVLVARAGVPILSEGYGLANREHGVPCTPQTKYRIGSITKQFAAAAVMLLQDDGELDVRDELELFLPELPATWQPITLHQLLSHQSGLWNVTNDVNYMNWSRLPARPAKTIERVFERELDFEPGSSFSYSNTGYLTLALVIEEASGQKWERFLRERLLEPAGMRDTGHDRNDTVLLHRAAGYTEFQGKVYNAAFHDMSIPIGAGDIYSTTEDLLRWNEALYGGELLSASALEVMTAPNRANYAYGLMVGMTAGQRSISHGGGIFGFVSDLAYFPDERVTVVVLANNDAVSAGLIGVGLAERIFAE